MTRITSRLAALCVSFLLVFVGAAAAQDIELFVNSGSGATGRPNIVFLIDNPANWDGGSPNKKREIHDALYEIFTEGTFNNQARIGLMAFTHNNKTRGAQVLAAVRELTDAYAGELAVRLKGESGTEYRIQSTNNSPYATALDEVWRYYAGVAPRSGLGDVCDGPINPLDFSAFGYQADPNKSYEQNRSAFCSWIRSGSRKYVSPVQEADEDECKADNYVILLSNGQPDSGENKQAYETLRSLGGNSAVQEIDLGKNNYSASWSNEYSRWMRHSAEPAVISYVINVGPSNPKNKPDIDALAALSSLAKQGGGEIFYADEPGELKNHIVGLLEKILANNTVFASSTLPVSVNVRGTNLNQVYMGVFRPAEELKPRWSGNLKMYQLQIDGNESVYLADARGNPAEDAENGFLRDSSVSFWTRDSDFWDFDDPDEIPDSDLPDGKMVEKGAVAQRLRDNWGQSTGESNRALYTCVNEGGRCERNNSLSDFPFSVDNKGITAGALAGGGALTAEERAELIDWVHGGNNYSPDSPIEGNRAVRASIHGDVLHSRPAVVNYGNDTDIVVFYGSNDGIIHAVRGGRDETIDGTRSGDELWGLVLPEFFDRLQLLRDNAAMPVVTDKPYFADGAIVADDKRPDGKIYLYITMRRGGRFMYALDVTDPGDPRFLWKRSHEDDGWSELGETWSEPKPVTLNLAQYEEPKRVLIFGAGYDSEADDHGGARSMGRGVFVVDADTGDMLWQAVHELASGVPGVSVPGMDYSIPSDVTVLNRDLDREGYVDRAYVGDTGGNLWRLDIGDPDPANWRVHKLASIGADSNGRQRKFLYAPDVVYGATYDSILIGSGNREKPSDPTQNAFYMFKDSKQGRTDYTLTEEDLYDVTALAAPDTEVLGGADGWYFRFLGDKEKVVGSAVTLAGTVFFNTHQEAVGDACKASLGRALSYQVNFRDGSSKVPGKEGADRAIEVPGGGYPPSPVPVIVEIDDKQYQAVISGTQVYTVDEEQIGARRKTYWYKTQLQ